MKTPIEWFRFRYYKTKTTDGREGVVLFGEGPDHYSAMRVINDFLGEDVLELRGGGIGVNLFLPESKLDPWQKLAMLDGAWDEPNTKAQIGAINLTFLKKLTNEKVQARKS